MVEIPPISPIETAIANWVKTMSLFTSGSDRLRALSPRMTAQSARQIAQAADQLSVAADFLALAAKLRIDELQAGVAND